MPRPKPKAHSGSWSEDTAFKLKDTDCKELIALAGLDNKGDEKKAKEMIEQVELALSQYDGMERALDRKPRPAAKLAEIKPINRVSKELLSLIDNLKSGRGLIFGGGKRSILETEDVIKSQIQNLVQYSKEAIEYLKDKNSHHGTKREAARNVSKTLLKIFDYYCDLEYKDVTGGEEFIVIAFEAINKKPPGDNMLKEVYKESEKTGPYIPEKYPRGKTIHSVAYFNVDNKS